LLLSTGFTKAAFLSAAAAVFVASSPAPLFFCCAHSGKAKNALIASAAHQLRISFLLSLFSRIPFDSRARLLSARRSRRARKTHCSRSTFLLCLQAPDSLPTPVTEPMKNLKKKGSGATRLFHNSLSVQQLPALRYTNRSP
jgi:hypothetical protein